MISALFERSIGITTEYIIVQVVELENRKNFNDHRRKNRFYELNLYYTLLKIVVSIDKCYTIGEKCKIFHKKILMQDVKRIYCEFKL